MSAAKHTPAVICPRCERPGRIVSLSFHVTRAACGCGNRWTTHTTSAMVAEADAQRAAAIAKATGSA